MPKAKTFVCDQCGKTEECGSEDAAEAEFALLFPGRSIKDAAKVCDECFEAIHPLRN